MADGFASGDVDSRKGMTMSELLEIWLGHATKRLSHDSRQQVWAEIRAHYESACEEALAAGASEEESDRTAVTSLGDAAAANRAYRKVLLTSAEAALLRETRYGLGCGSRRWLWLLPTLILIAAIRFFATGDAYFGWMLLTGAAGFALLLSAFKLPVFTPNRGRIFRALRWLWLIAILTLTMKSSWLMLITYTWPVFWVEWRLASLRRKLPVAQWPKQLYL
jgi:hypothetical protein